MDFISKPVVIGLAVVVFSMALYIAYLSMTNAVLKSDIKAKDAQIMVFQNANTEFERLVKKQDDAMALMRQQAVDRAKKAQKAIEDAKLKAKRFEIIASNISKMKRTSNDECLDTTRMVKTYLKAKK